MVAASTGRIIARGISDDSWFAWYRPQCFNRSNILRCFTRFTVIAFRRDRAAAIPHSFTVTNFLTKPNAYVWALTSSTNSNTRADGHHLRDRWQRGNTHPRFRPWRRWRSRSWRGVSGTPTAAPRRSGVGGRGFVRPLAAPTAITSATGDHGRPPSPHPTYPFPIARYPLLHYAYHAQVPFLR